MNPPSDREKDEIVKGNSSVASICPPRDAPGEHSANCPDRRCRSVFLRCNVVT